MKPSRACDCCGNEFLDAYHFEEGVRLWHCDRCGLYQQGTPPAVDLYDGNYHDEYARHLPRKIRTASVRLDCINRYLQNVTRIDLLDVGCSVGATIAAAKKRGWRAVGVDVSCAAVACCQALEMDARLMEDGNLPFADQSFDVVTAWHVLEHVHQVHDTLREWSRVLKPGGILALETPHGGCWRVRFWGKRLKNFWIPEHVYIFRPDNLRSILVRHGFEILPVPWFGRSQGSWGQAVYSCIYQSSKEAMRRGGMSKSLQLLARKTSHQNRGRGDNCIPQVAIGVDDGVPDGLTRVTISAQSRDGMKGAIDGDAKTPDNWRR